MLLFAAVAFITQRPSAPTSERMDAPVVVKPDIDSKRASMGLSPKRTYGRAPVTAAPSHPKATRAKPSLLVRTSSSPRIAIKRPIAKVKRAGRRKAITPSTSP